MRPTFYALSSGAPPAAIAVVRVSGPMAREVLLRLTRAELPPPRRAVVRWLEDPATGDVLDQALVLWLPGPDTVTGEDLVELHLHGGRAVVAAVLSCLTRINGVEAADPGAFTRRAFDNGRIDLSQVEGLADLLSAETELQRRSALAMSEGRLGARAAKWREAILKLAAQTEAQLDFSDESDVEVNGAHLTAAFEALNTDLTAWLAAPSAERLRDGIRLVIAGPPNAGKSTLLNALAGRDVAITAPVAGTTRDIVEAPTVINGIPWLLIDTAGLHDVTENEIEIEGIRRAHAAVARADIVLWLGAEADCPCRDRAVLIASRADCLAPDTIVPPHILRLSVATGEGMCQLDARLRALAQKLTGTSADVVALNMRQRALIAELAEDITAAAAAHDDDLIRAEHLRRACGALDRLVGRVGVEDMLDTLFSGFCIGK